MLMKRQQKEAKSKMCRCNKIVIVGQGDHVGYLMGEEIIGELKIWPRSEDNPFLGIFLE